MSKRRDIFIFVAKPDQVDAARTYLADWLRELDGHPGYLGGSVLAEAADELLPNTLVLLLEFESTEAARALWPKIKDTVNPLYPDDKSDTSPDQGAAFFDTALQGADAPPLRYTRGNGLLARMLHIHASECDAYAAAGAGSTTADVG